MTQKMKSAFAALALSMVFGGTAQSQDLANDTPFGDWRVSCEALSLAQTFCQLVQQQTVTNTNELAGRFAAFPAENGGAVFLAQVPIGAYLPAGAVFRLDDGEATEQKDMIWQRCLGAVCEAATLLDAETLAAMDDVGAMLFGYRMENDGEPIVLRLNLNRFSEGLTALRGAN